MKLKITAVALTVALMSCIMAPAAASHDSEVNSVDRSNGITMYEVVDAPVEGGGGGPPGAVCISLTDNVIGGEMTPYEVAKPPEGSGAGKPGGGGGNGGPVEAPG